MFKLGRRKGKMNELQNGAIKTQNDLIKLQFALPADEWIIQMVHEDNQGQPIRDIVTRHKLFSTKLVAWYRAKNANGWHVYGRPYSTRYVLIDDVQHEGIVKLRQDGLTPTAVIETSPDNFQVWITVSENELPKLVASRLAKLLELRYSTDTGSADALHLGRLPGLRNKKFEHMEYPGHGGPLVLLRTALTSPVIPDGIDDLIKEAKQMVDEQSPTSSPSAPRGGRVFPNNSTNNIDIDPSRSPMTSIEAFEIFEAEVQCQAKRKGWSIPIQKGLRSDADYAVIYSLRKYYGYDPDDLAALLTYESEKAAERGMDYVIRTVSSVCQLDNQRTHSI
jgi:hypothetical protein